MTQKKPGKQICIYVSHETLAKLRERAKRDDRSVSNTANRLISEMLSRSKREGEKTAS